MIKIAIVEDEKSAQDKLTSFILEYCKKEDVDIDFEVFSDAISFLNNYRSVYDLLFLDIDMPGLDGLTAAKKLREIDKKILIIFVTNLAQFAVKGYEVDALDYIVKPFSYSNFASKMKRAVEHINFDSDMIVINRSTGMIRLLARDVKYIESIGHKIIYHSKKEDITGGSKSLSDLEEELKDMGFLRCNNCYLVNFRFIKTISGFDLEMTDSTVLQISRPRKKKFMEQVALRLSKGY